jgi:hypothetical protein
MLDAKYACMVQFRVITVYEEDEEDVEKTNFPPRYNEIIKGEWELDESKAPKWMDVEIKMREFEISIDGWKKMARIGD